MRLLAADLAVPQDFYSSRSVSVERSDWRVLRAGPTYFLMALAAHSLFLFNYFLSIVFLSMGWYYGAGVFGLIGCISLSPSLGLPTFFNNDDDNNNNIKA